MTSVTDYLIIAIYLIGIALFGLLTGKKQSTTRDYFLGSKSVPWWIVTFSIVAAETSTLTFISIPGLAYLTNLNFLQVTIGYLLGRIVIAFLFLPAYRKGELFTAYQFLENRFGKRIRVISSVTFLFTRIAADGVRLFATAIPLKIMLNIDYPVAIIIIALISLVYTITGGIKSVIWVDALQMFIYIGGAVVALVFLTNNLLPEGVDSIWNNSEAFEKLSIFNIGYNLGIAEFFSKPYTLLGGLIGGAFLSMASHGTDQLIVQRLLTTKTLKDGQKAILGSGIIVIIQFALFLFLGIALFTFYGKIDVKPDEIFPLFIIQELPSGISGIIIAGLFAAAMSTIAGSMTSLSSSTMIDLVKPRIKKLTDAKELVISRWLTLFWAVALVFSALLFISSSKLVVELALSIASFTYGALLGVFLLGLLLKKIDETDAIVGFLIGIVSMTIIIYFDITAWTWYTFIGVVITISSGFIINKIRNKSN